MSRPSSRPLAALFLLVSAWTSQAIAAPDCTTFTTPILQRVNPTSQANLLTRSQGEADGAVRYGFTDDRGTLFKAPVRPGTDLVGVHRLYNGGSGDFVWISSASEIANAIARYGYVDQGINFYASPGSASCLQPVYRFVKDNKHRHAALQADRDTLVAAGWRAEGVSFHAVVVAAPAEERFSIAVIPDTQQEAQAVMPGGSPNLGDLRFRNRAQWLADNRTTLNLKFVAHSGDVTNWGERDEHEYTVVSEGIKPLDDAGIPYALAIGNHDTRAVCPGGSACPGESASANVRATPLFNRYFNGRFRAQAGQYETGKVDNNYALFDAGGLQWMVLTLELWPRQGAIDWAKGVVATHPGHNVIVVTHAYLNGDGSISTSNGGYGATSPKHLFDTLIKVYPNIRMVFSGHVGLAASREDIGTNGNRIASFLQTFHSRTNPVRLVEIDPAAGTIATHVYAPGTNEAYPEYDKAVTGMDFVR